MWLKKRMIAILLMLGIVLTFVSGTVVAASTEYYDELADYVEDYNDNLDKVPSLAKRMFANERVNFFIKVGDDEEIIGVATDAECAITEFESGGLEDPTIRAYIDGAVIEDLQSDFTLSKALAALKGIRLEGVGFGKVVKVFFLNIFKAVSGLFVKG